MVVEVPNIKRGFLVASSEPGEDGMWRLKTEGVNIQVLLITLGVLLCSNDDDLKIPIYTGCST